MQTLPITPQTATMACSPPPANEPQIQVLSIGQQPASRGSGDYFAGDVYVDQIFQGSAPARISGGLVSFTPGARTAWHTHPLGQTLYVVSGSGRVQMAGQPVKVIRPGDLVWIPAGVKHWHGAAPHTAMTHLAFAEQLDGKVVTWLELLEEEEYQAAIPEVHE